MIPIYGPDDIRPFLDIQSLIPTARQAFCAISDGTAQAPVSVLHPNMRADIHVKSAVIPDCPIFTVKMAGWSQVLVDQNQPASSGLIAVFESETCKPLAILQDDHLISDYRTAAAGALVADLFAAKQAQSALIVGTGMQARLQAEALLLVRPIKVLKIWGRARHKACEMRDMLHEAWPDIQVDLAEDLANTVPHVDVIVAATGAKEPVIHADWVRPGQHITSVGSDDMTKCEIDPAILTHADVYVDSTDSACKFGTTFRALSQNLITPDRLIEIGATQPDIDRPSHGVTVTSLSGLGVQDLTAINGFWHRLTGRA